MRRSTLLKSSVLLIAPLICTANIKASTISVPAVNTITDTTVVSEQGNIAQDINNTSIYDNLGISNVDNYVNIRKEPKIDSEIIGKIYRGSATTITEKLDGWVKVNTGGIEGYVMSQYLAIGSDAQTASKDFGKLIATVSTQTLKVREKDSTESICLSLIPEGEQYNVLDETDDWVEIKTDGETGYIHKDYVNLTYEFEEGISIQDEQEIQDVKEAEEREESASQQVSYIKTKTVKRTSVNKKSTSSNKVTVKQQSSTPVSDSSVAASNSSSTGTEIVNYARQFVGNPYVWGGTSLTNGADCSGFTQSVFKKFGYSLPRVSGAQAGVGTSVSLSNLQPGDLLFYTSGGSIGHVSIYMGNSKVVHASSARIGITISNYSYRKPAFARRIVN